MAGLEKELCTSVENGNNHTDIREDRKIKRKTFPCFRAISTLTVRKKKLSPELDY